MRINIIVLFFTLFQLHAATSYAQRTTKPITLSNVTIEEVLSNIEKNSDYFFLYNNKTVDTSRIVSVDNKSQVITDILGNIFKNTDIAYTIMDKQIILSPAKKSVTQQTAAEHLSLKGVVKDEKGEPLIGVSISLVGNSSIGTITDFDGNFSLKLPMGSSIKISYIGYVTQNIRISKPTINIIMVEDSKQLGEVVVTAMGIERKEHSLTYATQKLDGKELMKVQDANFVNSLQGKASGITITPSAGGAGGASKILLRGNKSVLGNNSPLIVLDGIPLSNNIRSQAGFDSGAGLTYSSSSEGSDPLSSINPNDIESINILKGANAAALYGSAAANGVIMITTKKGKEGKIDITLSSSVTIENPMTTPEIQNIYGANLNLLANTLSIDSWGKKMQDMTKEELAYGKTKLRNYGNDDVADFFRTGVTLNNAVSLSGGSEKMRSYFSYSNSHADGMIEKNNYNRNSLSFRQSYFLFNQKLKINFSLNYVHSVTRNRPGGGTAMNPLYDLYTVPRNIDMAHYATNYSIEKGSWISNPQGHYASQGGQWIPSESINLNGKQQQWAYSSKGHNNPYWLVNEGKSKSSEERAYGYITANYEIINGLNTQGRLSMDRTRFTGTSARSATTWNPAGMEDRGMYGQDIIHTNEIYVDALLTYNKEIKDFSISATGGLTGHTIKGETQKIWTAATTFDPNRIKLSTLINFFEPTASGGSPSEKTYYKTSNWDKGLLFTGQVGYKGLVYIDASYRRDWYRAFKQFEPRGFSNNYGYFSAGVNALVHRLIKMPEVITNFKVRTSYSEVGNSIPNILFSTNQVNAITGAVNPSKYGRFENPIPEKTKSFEAGFDLSLFENSFDMDFTYYNTTMHNSYLLYGDAGGKTRPVNSGQIRNQGVEITMSYSLDIVKDLLWKTSVNFSYNDNEILKTYHDEHGNEVLIDQKIAGNKVQVKYKEGGSYGDMYATDFARNEDGSIKLTDDGSPQLSNDLFGLYIGNMNADWQLGWSNTFSYKGLSFYFLIDGKIGGKIISFTEAELDRLGISQRTADARLAAENNPALVWKGRPAVEMPDGNLAPIDSYYKTIGGDVNATQYIYDATNFRLRELSLSYMFRNLFGMGKNLSVSAVARNLFFIYRDAPVDPEVSLSTQNGLAAFEIFNMPSATSYGVSLKVNF